MFPKRLLILSLIVGGLAWFDVTTPVQQSMACDSCARLAIQQGFQQLDTQASLIKDAVNQLNDQIGKMKDQIADSGDETVKAIDGFSSDLQGTLTENNNKLVESLSGLYIQIGNQFAMMNEANKKYFLEFQNDVTNQFAATEKIIRSRNQLYGPGGALGSFRGGDITDGLIQLYTSNSMFSKAVFAINAKFITRWNERDPDLIQYGKSGLFAKLSSSVTGKADELLNTLNTQPLLTNKQYQDLIYYVAFGLNPDQIDPLNDQYLSMVAKQSNLLMDITAKAPIIPLSEKNMNFFGEFVPPYEEECPQALVEQGTIPEGMPCTSLDSILNTLLMRSSSPNWQIASTLGSKRAFAEEELRSQIIANILQKRLLDVQRSQNVINTL
jgi:hypothetical protein